MPIAWELVTPQVIGRNVFVIISTPVYILFLVVIIRFRKKAPFNSAFFRLSVVTGIMDLFSIVHIYITYEYAMLGITTQLLRPLLSYDALGRYFYKTYFAETTRSPHTLWPLVVFSPTFNGRWQQYWRTIATQRCISQRSTIK